MNSFDSHLISCYAISGLFESHITQIIKNFMHIINKLNKLYQIKKLISFPRLKKIREKNKFSIELSANGVTVPSLPIRISSKGFRIEESEL